MIVLYAWVTGLFVEIALSVLLNTQFVREVLVHVKKKQIRSPPRMPLAISSQIVYLVSYWPP